jgi:AcrR family transcriptional regulator
MTRPGNGKHNDSNKARSKILLAADELFGQVGFDAATTREIAERSGVNKALIHYHFKNKEGLLTSVLDHYYEKLAETVLSSLQSGTSLRDKMVALVYAYVDFLAENRNFHRIVQREASGGRHMDQVHAHTAPLFEVGTTLVQQAFPFTRSGEMAAEQLLMSFYGMIISYFSYAGLLGQLIGDDPLSAENLELRKRHLARMIDVTIASIEAHEGAGDESRDPQH